MLQILFLLCLRVEGDAGAAFLVAFLYIMLPMTSLFLPFWAARGGVPPIAAFFPIGGAALIFSHAPPWLCGACMLLSLFAASAGQEWEKRKKQEKGSHHGGRSRK